MTAEPHAVPGGTGHQIRPFITAGHVSGARAPCGSLPAIERPIAARGHEALRDKGIGPCIPGRPSGDKPVRHDKHRYGRRDRVEIIFARPTDRRIATRHDRGPKASYLQQRSPQPSSSGYERQ